MTKRWLFIGLLSFICFYTLQLQAQSPARLIIRGDDMGFSHSGNMALAKTFTNGIVSSIEVIVPSPWFPEAVAMLKLIPKADVGIHLALTSEWDMVKWRPITHSPSLCDSNGYFLPMVFKNKNYPNLSIIENQWKIEEIEKEFRAQIEMAIKHLPNVSHISSHMGCTNLSEEVLALTKKLASEYGLIFDLTKYQVKNISYLGPHNSLEEKLSSFSKMLDTIVPGNTYLFVDHPGINESELQAIHHIGYEDVASDRQGVTDLFLNKKIYNKIKALKIEIIGYNDL